MSSASKSKHESHISKSEGSNSTGHHMAGSSMLTAVITPSRRSSRTPSPAPASQRKKTASDVGHKSEIPAAGSPQVRLTEEQVTRLAAQVKEKKSLAKLIKQCDKVARHLGWSVTVSKANPESRSGLGVSLNHLFDKLQAIDTFSLDTDEVKPIKADFLRYFKGQCDSDAGHLKKIEGLGGFRDDLFGFGSSDGLNIDLSPKKLNELHDALTEVLRITQGK